MNGVPLVLSHQKVYDIRITKNRTLTEELRDEMFEHAFEISEEDILFLNNWSKLHEKDRFYNWYHGFTEIKRPTYDYVYGINYYINTSATSGVVTTQYYGEKFQPDLVDRKLHYEVHVIPPESVRNNQNVNATFQRGEKMFSIFSHLLGSLRCSKFCPSVRDVMTFLMRSSVLFLSDLISLRAAVQALYLWRILT